MAAAAPDLQEVSSIFEGLRQITTLEKNNPIEDAAKRFFAICNEFVEGSIDSKKTRHIPEDDLKKLAQGITLNSSSDVVLQKVQKLRKIIKKEVNLENYDTLQENWA